MRFMRKIYILFTISIISVDLVLHLWFFKLFKQEENYKTDIFQTYLLFNSKCKVPDYESYSGNAYYNIQSDYIPCTIRELLTEIVREDDAAYLIVKSGILDNMTTVYCCYCNVTSNKKKNLDQEIDVSACRRFKNKTEIIKEVIFVKCYDNRKLIYSNVHAIISRKKLRSNYPTDYNGTTRKPNILILGVSSVSKLDFRKLFSQTYYYLKYKNWLEYKIYNRISNKTNLNLIAMLTGVSYIAGIKTKSINNSVFTWSDFQRLGYITAYAKDSIDNGVSRFPTQSFQIPPTDFYFRPYLIASHMLPKLVLPNNGVYCTGPESTVDRILNLAKDFLTISIENSTFSLFWMDSFRNGDTFPLEGLDVKLKIFFQYLYENDVMKNTIVIFLSDEGYHYGDISVRGWYARQLPFLFIWIPPSFRREYSERFECIRENSNRLATPFDLFLTMQEILAMYEPEYEPRLSRGCPKCKSLFTRTLTGRSCREAQISNEWCSCLGYRDLTSDGVLAGRAQNFLCKLANMKINKNVQEGYVCDEIRPYRLIYAWVTENRSDSYEINNNFLKIKMETYPLFVLEATLRINYLSRIPTFTLVSTIQGLDLNLTLTYCKQLYTRFYWFRNKD